MSINGHHQFPVRIPNLELSPDLPKYFAGGDPVLSSFFAALSTLFPDGERFFITSIRSNMDKIEEGDLKESMRSFIGQEAHHGHMHDAFNEWLALKGYPVKGPLSILGKGIKYLYKLTPTLQVAYTSSFEHFTALFGESLTDQDPVLQEETAKWDQTILKLWLWHGIEENEHKAVAFDVLQKVNNSYWLRIITMIIVSLFTMLMVGLLTSYYLIVDRKFKPSLLWATFKQAWISPGFLRRTVRPWFAYFRRDFHPWERDNRESLAEMARKLDEAGMFEYAKPRAA